MVCSTTCKFCKHLLFIFICNLDFVFRYSYIQYFIDNTYQTTQPTSLSVQSQDEYPAFVAWERAMKKTNNLKDMNKLFPQYIREGETITSLQWMSQGMHYWYSAMMCQLGEMAGFANDKEMGAKLESLKMQMSNGSISRSTFDTKRYELTGCPPSQGDEFQGLLEGLIHLGGDTIPLEMGSGKFIPSPEWLKDYRPQQYVAVLMCILYEIVGCRSALNVGNIYKPAAGEDLVFSQSLCGSAWSFLENAGQTNGGIFEFPKKGVTPEEAITFIKKKLDEGKTWEDGIRKYVSCLYRGTILSAWLTRLVAGLAVALPEMKWARTFIELADQEWKVSENESYEMHGSCFRPSFQVNIMCMELQTAETLRNDDEPNLDEIVYEFKLAQQIINYAKTVQPPKTNDFKKHMFYVTFGRKPLAFACGRLGNNMNMLNYNQELLEKAIEAAGLMDSERDDNLLSFLVERSGGVGFRSSLAETYHEAAKAQLQDDKEAAILWWCYAAHLVDCGGYTMGHLRAGINNAVVASQRLDPLFVLPGPWKGSVYQKEALLVARYYQDETDDFVLPQLQRSRRPDGKLSVFIDGNMLCYDLNQGYRISNKREKEQNKKKDDYLDVSAVKEEIDQEMKSSND